MKLADLTVRAAAFRHGMSTDDLAKVAAAAENEQHAVVILRRIKAGWSVDDAVAAPYYGA